MPNTQQGISKFSAKFPYSHSNCFLVQYWQSLLSVRNSVFNPGFLRRTLFYKTFSPNLALCWFHS